MVDTDQENTIAQGKSILKRRVRNDKKPVELAARPDSVDGGGATNASKRYVTFDETIMVKNDKDCVVKRPLKLELVIDNWKSSNTKGNPEVIQTDPGIVKRLVDEFNSIDDTLTDNLHNDRTLLEEDKVTEDEPIRKNQTHILSLCEALEMVNLTTTDV